MAFVGRPCLEHPRQIWLKLEQVFDKSDQFSFAVSLEVFFERIHSYSRHLNSEKQYLLSIIAKQGPVRHLVYYKVTLTQRSEHG